MDLIKSYSLVKSQDGYDLVLYFDAGDMDVEFASEFDSIVKDSSNRLNQNLAQQIAQKFPNIKINSVKVMAGAVLISSFMIASTPNVKATGTTSEDITQAQSAYNYSVNFSINGKVQAFQNNAMIYNDITYVPIYEFGQAIGANVWTNNTSNTVGIVKNNTNIAFVRGSSVARVNGIQTSMPASITIGDTTYAPLKFLAENLGYSVTYNSSTRTADISNNNTQYTVLAGDTLWKISQKYGISVDSLKSANNLTSDTLQIGQTLTIPKSTVNTAPVPNTSQDKYTVAAGDTLWSISQKFGITVASLKSANNLTSDILQIGQTLNIPKPTASSTPTPSTSNNTTWPAITYIVQGGDTATSISKKFGVSADNLLKYNYMDYDDWFDAGDKIAISGYAPRVYTVTRGQSSVPAQRGALVDWVLEGQYLVKRNDTFTIVDVDTGKQFKAKMLGGYNHIDMEPLTYSDTAVMKSLFGTWQWSPRAVVIYIDGMNIAASLSGMPHDVDTIDNGVTGHFDLYMKNSTSHSSTTSTAYMLQHANMVLKAAGQ